MFQPSAGPETRAPRSSRLFWSGAVVGLVLVAVAIAVLWRSEPLDSEGTGLSEEGGANASASAPMNSWLQAAPGAARPADPVVHRATQGASHLVVDEDGNAIAGAELVLCTREMNSYEIPANADAALVLALQRKLEIARAEARVVELRRWRADEQGGFELEVLPDGEIVLDAHDGRRSLASPRIWARDEPREIAPLRLVLVRGCALSGVVRDAEGRALNGVALRLESAAGPEGVPDPVPARTAKTDAEGRYELLGMRRGCSFGLRFEREHYFSKPESLEITCDADRVLDHTLIAHAWLEGVALGPDAQKLENAAVELTGCKTVRTDAEGRFQFRPRVEGSSTLQIFARTEDHSLLARADLTLGVSERRGDFVLELERAPVVRGRVVDAAGQGIGAAQVELRWKPVRNENPGASGELAKAYKVRALQEMKDQEMRVLELRRAVAERAAALRAVEVARAAEAADRLQEIQKARMIEIDSLMSRIKLENVDPREPSTPSLFESRRAATADAEGRFEFRCVWPGDYAIAARHEEHLPAEAQAIHVDLADVEVELLLRRGARIEGTIRGPAGEPVPGAHLVVTRGKERCASLDADAAGAYVLAGLESGELEMWAELAEKEWIGQLRAVHVEEGNDYPGTDVRIEGSLVLEGRVIDSDGAPVPGAALRLGHWAHSELWCDTKSNADGSYRAARLVPGDYSLSVRAEGYVPLELESFPIDASMRRDLILPRAASISGTISDPDGLPVPGAHVFLYQEDHRDQMQTDSQGAYAFGDVRPGACDLYARSDDYVFNARERCTIDAGERLERMDLRLVASGRALGRVVDPKGLGLAGVRIAARTDPGEQGAREATTGPDGSFELKNLYRDRYRIRIVGRDEPSLVIDAREGGTISGLELRLDG